MISLNNLFGARAFLIPKNQRGYSWTKKEIHDLFSDLELMGDKCHYLGTIICSKTGQFMEEESQNPNFEYSLEDGQQRLTTFLIIIKLLSDRFKDVDGNETIESMQLDRLLKYKNEGIKLRIRNENNNINDYFSYLLLNTPSSEPEFKTPPMRCLSNAYGYIKEKLGVLSTREQLLKFRNKICNQVQLIDVDLSDLMIDRYLTFDAINSRGLPLTEFDKIKNFCILICERRSIEIKPDDEWYKAISNLEKFSVGHRSNESTFISELFSSYHGLTSSNSDVHEKFVNEYRVLLEGSSDKKANSLKGFIQLWESYSKSYGFISNKDKVLYLDTLCNRNSLDWLIRIERLGLVGITRRLLAAAHYSIVNHDDFCEIARACEIYTFRMHALARYRVDKNSKALLNLSHQVLCTSITKEEIIIELGRLLESSSTLIDNASKLVSGELNYKNWSYTYYFLYEYEMFNSSINTIEWANSDERKSESIEHILPQNTLDQGWWQKHWPNTLLAEKWCHRLGNLVLTNGNSILARKPIDLKISDAESEYSYTCNKATNCEKLIHNYTDGSTWKESQILRREVDMLNFVIERWALPTLQDSGVILYPQDFYEYVPNFEAKKLDFTSGFDLTTNCFSNVDEEIG